MIFRKATAVPVLAAFLLFFNGGSSLAGDAANEIETTLDRWMSDFNAGKTERVCDLFAADVRADFRGYPTRGHREVCDLLVKSLSDATRSYSYALDIREILVFGDVAVVRLVWTLTIKKENGEAIKSVEPGMDVFRRQADGSWKIVRYMAYEE